MENDGKELEKLIHLINQSIEPDAVVEHNVFLPVIGSPSGRTRQCDIVITSGPKHRQTITIIEVQDRNSKVDINTFNGWLEKLNEVGAQHLVCVSRLEFAESIKEKAILSGNKVKLVTISEIGNDKIPLGFLQMIFNYSDFKILESIKLDLAYSKPETEFLGIYETMRERRESKPLLNFDNQTFSFDKHELKSLYHICRDYIIVQKQERNNSGTDKIAFSMEHGTPLFLFINNAN